MVKWVLRKIGIWIYRLFETQIDNALEKAVIQICWKYGLLTELFSPITPAPDELMNGAILDKSNEHFHVIQLIDPKDDKDIPKPNVLPENIGKHKFVNAETEKIAKDGMAWAKRGFK